MLHHNWVCVRPGARLQKGPYDIVKVEIGQSINNEKEDQRQTKKGSEVPFPCSQGLSASAELKFGSKMEAFTEFGVFRSFRLSLTIYEFKILQSDKVAGVSRNNNFQASLAG